MNKPAGSHRSTLLQEAERLVCGDRNNAYGPPHQDFQRTADVLTGLGFRHNSEPIMAHHIALVLAAVKLSRLTWSPDKTDSWVDLAGYAACGLEAYELTKRDYPDLSGEDGHTDGRLEDCLYCEACNRCNHNCKCSKPDSKMLNSEEI